jgi:hypothetical protein
MMPVNTVETIRVNDCVYGKRLKAARERSAATEYTA